MNFLQVAAKFLGWLTGVLAGIGAVFYACGYLITQTQFHLLGIHILLPANRDYYLHEGANFFIVTGLKVGILALGLVLIALVICIPWSILKKTGKGGRLAASYQKRFGHIPTESRWQWQAATLLLLVLLLVYPLLSNLYIFRAPLELAGLLTTAQDAAYSDTIGEEAQSVFASLKNGDTGYLEHIYHLLLTHCLFAGFLVWAANRITATWPLRTVLTFPFVVVFTIYLFLLPLDYAVLQKRFVFPTVSVMSTVSQASDLSGELHLLNKTDKELILWNRSNQQILWLPIAKLAKIEIGTAAPVFAKPPPDMKEIPKP